MKIYFEKDDGTLTITFTIVEESVEKNLLMLENDLPDLDTVYIIIQKCTRFAFKNVPLQGMCKIQKVG